MQQILLRQYSSAISTNLLFHEDCKVLVSANIPFHNLSNNVSCGTDETADSLGCYVVNITAMFRQSHVFLDHSKCM